MEARELKRRGATGSLLVRRNVSKLSTSFYVVCMHPCRSFIRKVMQLTLPWAQTIDMWIASGVIQHPDFGI